MGVGVGSIYSHQTHNGTMHRKGLRWSVVRSSQLDILVVVRLFDDPVDVRRRVIPPKPTSVRVPIFLIDELKPLTHS